MTVGLIKLRFFGNDDRSSVVVTAVRTDSVLELLFVAVGAFHGRRGDSLVMGTALPATGFGVTTFWIWHRKNPLSVLDV